MCLTGFQNRLLAYYTLAFDFALTEACVKNVPMTTKQLYGVFAMVFDGNAIRKNVMVLTRTGIRRLVLRLHTYLYPLGYFRYHTLQKY